MNENPSPTKPGHKSIQRAESKLAVLPPDQAQALFSPVMMEEAVAVLFRNLRATKRMWSVAEREFVEVPDAATQVEAAKTLLSYGIGAPVQRVISVAKTNVLTTAEMEQTLKRSPALQKSLRAVLDKAAAPDPVA